MELTKETGMFHLRRGGPPAVVDKKIIKQKKLIMGFWLLSNLCFSLSVSTERDFNSFDEDFVAVSHF